MADTIVEFSAAGNTFRRPDGTHYYRDPYFIGPPLECVAPGQTVAPTPRPGYGFQDFNCSVGGACVPCSYYQPTAESRALIGSNAPTALGQIADVVSELVDRLGTPATTALGSLPPDRLPGSLQALIDYQTQVASGGPSGVLPVLRANPLLGVLASLDLEAQRAAQLISPTPSVDEFQIAPYTRLENDIATTRAYYAGGFGMPGILDQLGLSGFNSSVSSSLPALFSQFGLPGGGYTFPTAVPPISGGGGGAIDQIGGALIGIVSALSRAGVIRGTVGELFAPQAAAGVSPSSLATGAAGGGLMPTDLLSTLLAALSQGGQMTVPPPTSSIEPSIMGTVEAGAISALQSLFGLNGGNCAPGVRVNMMNAPGIFKAGCGPCGSSTMRLRRRMYVDNPDGSVSILMNLGKATHPSPRRALAAARQLARGSGYTVARSGRARAGRRRPR